MANHHRRADKELVQQILLDATHTTTIPASDRREGPSAAPGSRDHRAPRRRRTLHERTQNPAKRPPQRGHRNGYKPRKLKTRVGTLELLVPQDREGTFSTQLFAHYQSYQELKSFSAR
jgi:hypothetical protein